MHTPASHQPLTVNPSTNSWPSPQPRGMASCWGGVRQLPPGHWLRISADGESLHQYWSIPDQEATRGPSFEDAAETLEALLAQSVERRLLSDVKLGCQLSGGVDSSFVSALAAASLGSDIDAISMIPDNAEWSEEPWMDQVVAVSQIQIHKIPLLADTIVDHFASAVWHMDQPTPGATAAALMELARAAKPRVTVLLSGEGADELLGGYAKYAQAAFRERLGGPLLALLRHAPGRGRRFGSLLGDRWGETDRVGAFISAGAMERRDLRALRPAVDTSALVDRRRKVFGESTGDFVADALKYDSPDVLRRAASRAGQDDDGELR